ncbi:uncharacterized protein STAUR_5082 [Stigmatella aurantiaca DW4/3-1]|uniref:Uncharacterized protein n=1 Tax=Stigmatella aurantiaca (strain DW4/3-1) TaxID=378806 RepID=E3FI64_STIAD|nr:uncharacterized protein STAUR_5082 [Stigmatella aurantiaca DW4/3-1]
MIGEGPNICLWCFRYPGLDIIELGNLSSEMCHMVSFTSCLVDPSLRAPLQEHPNFLNDLG